MSGNSEGMIFNIQDYSIHDGDGVRTIIFFLGCPLRCQWCANPESQTTDKKLFFYKHKCINCQSCTKSCPQKLIPNMMERPNRNCNMCGICEKNCPAKALSVVGEKVTVEEIKKRIERDLIFFRHSGGGITISGGEPFFQKRFLKELTDELYEMGLSIWIETSGKFSFAEVAEILKNLEHIFVDIKVMDEKEHIKYTGAANKDILENIKSIYNNGIPMTIRIPSIKNLNLTKDNIEKTARFVSEFVPGTDVELLPYHKLGKNKFIAMGNKEEDFIDFQTPSEEELKNAVDIFKKFEVEARVV